MGNIGRKEQMIDNENFDQIVKDHPRMLYLISPEGILYTYNTSLLHELFQSDHHYTAYLKFAQDYIKNSDSLSFELVPLLQERENLINSCPVENYLEEKEKINYTISHRIRKHLLENHYFIVEGWLDERILKYTYILTPFWDAPTIQKEAILKLYFDLGLDSYEKKSTNDKDGIILEKMILKEEIKKK